MADNITDPAGIISEETDEGIEITALDDEGGRHVGLFRYKNTGEYKDVLFKLPEK